MKKSEMIVMMCRYYNMRQYELEQGWLLKEQFFDKILELVEELGMLPPEVPGKYDPVPTVTPTGNNDYHWIREWEAE